MYGAHGIAGFFARATGMMLYPSRSNSCADANVSIVMMVLPRP
jgi:hypothetical protein